MKLALVKYNAGNIASINHALQRLGVSAIVTDDVQVIKNSDKVIFPGVGEASSAMHSLKLSGLNEIIPTLKQPVLGICLGMQLMCSFTEENNTEGLGVFPHRLKKFTKVDCGNDIIVPHMAWNKLSSLKGVLFKGVDEGSMVYFAHSYYAPLLRSEDLSSSEDFKNTSICSYGISFCSSLEKDNFFGVQFHPEKSAVVGEKILRNFCNI